MNKLDNVFNEMLANHAVVPTAATWEKIEAGLSKKNSPVMWMRWAAILVPGMILGLLWLSRPESSVTQAHTSLSPVPIVPKTQLAIEHTQTISRKKKHTRQKESTLTVQQPLTKPLATPASFPESITQDEALTIEPSLMEPPHNVSPEPKPIVLVYTLESIPPVSSPEASEKKTSLVRVVEFAQTVKYSDPLGDLRVMKEDLLAIDLRKKSTKKN